MSTLHLVSNRRALPQDPHAETQLLGLLSVIDGTMDACLAVGLEAQDFYRETHQRLFGLMGHLHEQGMPHTTEGWLPHVLEDPDAYGGASYATGLGDHAPPSHLAELLARRVKRHAIARRACIELRAADDRLRTLTADPAEIIEAASEQLQTLIAGAGGTEWAEPGYAWVDSAHQLDADVEAFQAGTLERATTGLRALDQLLTIARTDLVCLAGRPAMGKTAMALQVALRTAERGYPVAVFSLEMPRYQLHLRLACGEARVPMDAARSGEISTSQHDEIRAAMERYSRLPLYIDDTAGLNINQIRAKVRALKRQRPDLFLVVVDYLGLMGPTASMRRGASEHEILSATSKGLKALVKDERVAGLAIHQLNRQVEQRSDKRPQLSDLRGSGQIEQDIDAAVFLYRDDYYHPDTSTQPGLAEALVRKQRNGSTGTATCRFIGWRTRFEE